MHQESKFSGTWKEMHIIFGVQDLALYYFQVYISTTLETNGFKIVVEQLKPKIYKLKIIYNLDKTRWQDVTYEKVNRSKNQIKTNF